MGLFSRRWAYRIATIGTPMGVQTYPQMILATSGLVAYYRYEELSGGQFALDSGPNGWDWTLVVAGAPSLVTGRVGFGLDYGSGDARAEFPNPAVDALSFQGPQLTVETWFKWRGSGGATGSLRQDNPNVFQWPFNLAISPAGVNIDLSVDINSATIFGIAGVASFPIDTDWHHLVWTYDESSDFVLYIDGAVVNTGPAFGSIACDTDADACLLWDSEDVFWDETAYYNVILTPQQVLQHYNKGLAS